MINETYCGDCLHILPSFPDESVDMILTDLPYGWAYGKEKTEASWDTQIDLVALWKQYKRIIKPRGAVVLTATQPFTSALIQSNPKWFRHSWIWDKGVGVGFQIAKYRPLQQHEDILVFARKSPHYYPIMAPRPVVKKSTPPTPSVVSPLSKRDNKARVYDERYPTSILRIPRDRSDHLHPTQKPVALFAYLIRTYTMEGELVLDTCAGSGTTAIAAIRTDRQYCVIERDPDYYDSLLARITLEKAQPTLISSLKADYEQSHFSL